MSWEGLGPLVLAESLGVGGAGSVWRSWDPRRRAEVAVKVLHSQHLGTPTIANTFLDEVRATACLDHPAIVRFFDHGTTQEDDTSVLEGAVPAGAPWIAMELVRGDCLRSRCGQAGWDEIRSTLLAILDALAHAHARGLVHRDLKPANVLRDALGGGIKLTDFGLAHRVDAADGGEARCGTPVFMAPEQVEGRWRDFGPWTDLYALGGTGWMLATGEPPFAGLPLNELLAAQIHERPQRFCPSGPVPVGFEDWLRRLLEKDAGDRFQRAADAARSLLQLGDPVGRSVAPNLAALAVGATTLLPLAATVPRVGTAPPHAPPPMPVPTESFGTLSALEFTLDASLGFEGPVIDRVPAEWRGSVGSPTRMLLGAGLGLVGLRRIPTVGREAERDALWGALRDVAVSGCPAAVVLSGASGAGTSHLARWLCERAHELGSADVVTVRGGDGHDRGIPATILGLLGGWGADRETLRARVIRHLDGRVAGRHARALYDVGLAALGMGAASPAQEAAALERELRRTRDRPVILCIDDAHQASTAVTVARALLGGDRPVLVVATCPSGALPELTPGALHLPLEPLEAGAMETLARELLGLAPLLAVRIRQASGGNPGAAVSLVARWVQQDRLVQRGGRHSLSDAEAPPDDLADALDALVQPGSVAAQVLEFAAVLGASVDRELLRRVCASAGLSGCDRLLDHGTRRGWLVPGRAGQVAFASMEARDVVLAAARSQGRHRDACADVARALASEAAPDWSRIAALQVDAGAPAQAVASLVRAALGQGLEGDVRTGLARIERIDALADSAQLPSTHPDRVQARILEAGLLARDGAPDQSDRVAAASVALARRSGDPRLAVRALTNFASISVVHGRRDRAAALLEEAQVLARDADRGSQRRVALMWAQHHLARGELDPALPHLAAAVHGVDAPDGLFIDARRLRAYVHVRRGEVEEAQDLLGLAESESIALGDKRAWAGIVTYQADLAREVGDLDRAIVLNEQVVAWMRQSFNPQITVPMTNLALLGLETGDVDAARRLAAQVLEVEGEGGAPVIGALAGLVLMAALLQAGERAEAATIWTQAVQPRLDRLPAVPDVRDAAVIAAERARACRARSLVGELEELVAAQSAVLDRAS